MWSPALRTGTEWHDYLIFDLKKLTRISKVHVGTPASSAGNDLRKIETIRVEAGISPDLYFFVAESYPNQGFITFSSAVTARFIKLTVIPLANDAEPLPIGINK